MSKNGKIVALIVAVFVLAGIAVMAGSGGFLQGKFNLTRRFAGGIYVYKGSPVSIVVSPVTSEVPSEVTSEEGTSEVTSFVTSPVASAVKVSADGLKNVDLKKLPALTRAVLEKAAKDDFAKNPAKYTLSKTQRAQLYKTMQKK